MKLGVIGHKSEMAAELYELIAASTNVEKLTNIDLRTRGVKSKDLDTYVICAGQLEGEPIARIGNGVLSTVLMNNFGLVVKFLDQLFEVNSKARVIVLGSESGFKGSYDMAYAGAKAALHLYVEKKSLKRAQHLVCVAPTIMEDARMTLDRTDFKATLQRGVNRKMGRWLRVAEVARIAHFALNEDALCNTVIRATGGNW